MKGKPIFCSSNSFFNPKFKKKPFVHPIVYDRVNAAVSHRQPIEGQVHVWGVPETNIRISCEQNGRKKFSHFHASLPGI